MKITMTNVLQILSVAITGFEVTEEDWREDAPYGLLADIRRFLCERAGPQLVAQLNEFSVLLEKLLTEGDQDVHDMVMDSLEGLLECDRKNSITRFFLPRTQELWSKICGAAGAPGAHPKHSGG